MICAATEALAGHGDMSGQRSLSLAALGGGCFIKSKVWGALGAFALQIMIVITALLAVTFDRTYYSAEYKRLGIYDACGADAETLENATDMLLEYLSGRRENIEGRGVIDGAERDIFLADERAHMADVKRLFELAAVTLIIAGAAAVTCLLLSGRNGRAAAKGALTGIGLFALMLAAVGLWCAVDFSGAFNMFHRLLFRNGLWRMDPNTQFMIRMFPAEFFADMGGRIAVFTAAGIVPEIIITVCIAGFGGRNKRDGIQ